MTYEDDTVGLMEGKEDKDHAIFTLGFDKDSNVLGIYMYIVVNCVKTLVLTHTIFLQVHPLCQVIGILKMVLASHHEPCYCI